MKFQTNETNLETKYNIWRYFTKISQFAIQKWRGLEAFNIIQVVKNLEYQFEKIGQLGKVESIYRRISLNFGRKWTIFLLPNFKILIKKEKKKERKSEVDLKK